MAFHSQNFKLFSDKGKLCGLVMSKKSVFGNHISEFTQQRQEEEGGKSHARGDKAVILACFVEIFTNINVFWSFTKRSV